ncbi:prepilin peptidase [Pelagibius sp. Alg239-R121]|uniref:prepilin peptidase n=1 Tax=Pelagibius sp. Alg239-R121 TaxID=2993448 RepID=UPI002AC33DC2|nr:prepilin peptidase [Pelagibius sp. Alg239-R121]
MPHQNIFLLIFAPFVGSFLALLVVRLPAGRSVVFGRSQCDSCGMQLAAWDMVPLVSWLFLKGGCRYCGARIGILAPGVELSALGIAFWAVLVLPSGGALPWIGAALGWTLLTLALIDARHFLLPDALTLPLIPAGLLVTWWGDQSTAGPGLLLHHLPGAVIGFGGLYGIGWLYKRLRNREGLGLGDAKLMAAAGAWVGWAGLGSVLLWAALPALVAAVIWGRMRGTLSASMAVPFGTFLAFGFWLTWLYGPLGF